MNSKLAASLLSAILLTGGLALADESKGVPKDYPTKKCVVSDETLGEHGRPVKVSHNGTDVYLCCKNCVKDFNKDPEKFTKMVQPGGKK